MVFTASWAVVDAYDCFLVFRVHECVCDCADPIIVSFLDFTVGLMLAGFTHGSDP